MRTCEFEGCGRSVAQYGRGYCLEHHRIAFPCASPGCPNRVAVTSRSRACSKHRREAYAFMRKGVDPWAT